MSVNHILEQETHFQHFLAKGPTNFVCFGPICVGVEGFAQKFLVEKQMKGEKWFKMGGSLETAMADKKRKHQPSSY